jgi:hypothetical protein
MDAVLEGALMKRLRAVQSRSVLSLWPELRHAQMKVQLVQLAHEGAVAQVNGQLLLEIAVE